MDKLLRLVVAAALAWAGLSAYLTGGDRLWVAFAEAPDWGKALVGLAAFQAAPYLPRMAAGGSLLASAVQRAVILAGPAFAAMTAATALQHGVDEWRVGASAAGLMASFLAWRGLPAGGSFGGKGLHQAEATLREAVAVIARRSGLPSPSSTQDVRLRYQGSDGAPQFLHVPAGRA